MILCAHVSSHGLHDEFASVGEGKNALVTLGAALQAAGYRREPRQDSAHNLMLLPASKAKASPGPGISPAIRPTTAQLPPPNYYPGDYSLVIMLLESSSHRDGHGTLRHNVG
jgi:hypothetical protein